VRADQSYHKTNIHVCPRVRVGEANELVAVARHSTRGGRVGALPDMVPSRGSVHARHNPFWQSYCSS
jgi:hypothetical protein